jgi:putative ABC transport system ATP-binding protein
MLSVGQQQRVAMARALAGHPVLVLADEPTANLDRARAEQCLDLLIAFAGETGAALLVVTHDPAVLARFERRHELPVPQGEGLRGPRPDGADEGLRGAAASGATA